jgi:hypothetical protein
MNKGYAFGFLLVLLVVVLGFYVAFTGFVSTRDAVRAQPTAPPPTDAGLALRRPTSAVGSIPIPASTDTDEPTIPTPIPGLTATLTALAQPEAGEEAATPGPPTEPAEAEPPTPTAVRSESSPTVTAAPAAGAPPTPSPIYQFRLEGPPAPDPNYPSCCYIYGTIRDLAGLPLEGIRVQAFNEWITLDPAVSKSGGEAGQYNIPLGQDVVTWDIVIVDAAGNQVSTKATVAFDPSRANGYRVDWLRTY